jgi:hypothetical protein
MYRGMRAKIVFYKLGSHNQIKKREKIHGKSISEKA